MDQSSWRGLISRTNFEGKTVRRYDSRALSISGAVRFPELLFALGNAIRGFWEEPPSEEGFSLSKRALILVMMGSLIDLVACLHDGPDIEGLLNLRVQVLVKEVYSELSVAHTVHPAIHVIGVPYEQTGSLRGLHPQGVFLVVREVFPVGRVLVRSDDGLRDPADFTVGAVRGFAFVEHFSDGSSHRIGSLSW